MEPDAEQRARALVDTARRRRGRPPRWLWGVALVVATVCIGALVVGWFTRDERAGRDGRARALVHATSDRGGFAFGLAIGAAAGLAIGIAIGSRRSRR